jgi:5-formyltetrahydrofolate cyclo-ligase
MYKDELRRVIKNGRRRLPEAERWHKEGCIITHLMHRIKSCGVKSLMGYLAFDGEVSLATLLDDFQCSGGDLYLPRVLDKRLGIMETVLMPVPWEGHVVIGSYGISEPHPRLPPADPRVPEAVLVPGVAFDPTGARMGYGGGYYDRFLPQTSPTALLIGVAFDLQVVETLICDGHDFRVHEVCTESGCMRVSEDDANKSKDNLE